MTFSAVTRTDRVAWAQLSHRTRPDYLLGVNFQIMASEQFPMIAVEDRPLIILESGYSTP